MEALTRILHWLRLLLLSAGLASGPYGRSPGAGFRRHWQNKCRNIKQERIEENQNTTNLIMKMRIQILRWLSLHTLSADRAWLLQPIASASWLARQREAVFKSYPITPNSKNRISNTIKLNAMNATMRSFKWMLVLVLFLGAGGAWAQTSQSLTQDVCPGTEPYLVVPGDVNNTFLWSISTGTSGVDWTITTPNMYTTNVIWANPVAPVTYRLTLTETSGASCIAVVYVDVTVYPLPELVITDPPAICAPGTVDITVSGVTAGSILPGGTVLTYWTDASATNSLTDPTAVATSGTYYIQAVTDKGCTDIKPVNVTIDPLPALTIANPDAVCEPGTVDLTAAAVTAGSTIPAGTTLTYWTDASATTSLANPSAVAISGTYYILAETGAGCKDIQPVVVIVNPAPVLTITNPLAICAPGTVDLTVAEITAGSTLPVVTTLTYWTDASATTTLENPEAVGTSGTYYIQAETDKGCKDIKPVVVTIDPVPALTITNPDAVCEPGTVDLTASAVTDGSTLPAGTVLTYWLDDQASLSLTNPATVGTSGTYYIQALTAAGCKDIKPVNVVINPAPALTITNPLAICAPGTVDLTAAEITTGSTLPAVTTLTYWTDASATNPLANPEAVGTSGTYYIKAETNNGCIDIQPVVVTINPVPEPTFLTCNGDVCLDDTEEFTYTTQSDMTDYVWTYSADAIIVSGGTPTDNTITIRWTAAGVKLVTVNYSNSDGCQGAIPAECTFTVDPIPNTSPIFHD